MKTLRVAVLHIPSSDTTYLTNYFSTNSAIVATYYNNEEAVIDATNAQQYDLLVIDKNLEKSSIQKIEKLVDLIYPDAATVVMDYNESGFIQFKMDELIQKWKDSNTESHFKFHDGI